jgi:hypothetical protein
MADDFQDTGNDPRLVRRCYCFLLGWLAALGMAESYLRHLRPYSKRVKSLLLEKQKLRHCENFLAFLAF